MIVSAAAQCNLTVGGFLARAALAAAGDLDRTNAEIATERDVLTALFDSRRKLGWAGSNLNQVTKALNAGADAAIPQLEASLVAVRRAADAVHAAATAVLEHQQAA
ncbi:mobilization protein [Streptomyces sp. JJ38]|nr:mobilization protein [Streptomyces sp. JJ38]